MKGFTPSLIARQRSEGSAGPHRIVGRFLNLSLRSLTLASRFLLLFLLARYLEPADLGLYGLLVVTIGYALYLVGFDFYIYTTREAIGCDRSELGGLLKNQSALLLLLYLLFVPVLILFFRTDLLPWSVAPWFFVLLPLEHLGQEISRLLIALSRPLAASLVLFLRSGLWIMACAWLLVFEPESRVLDTVLKYWVMGGLAATILGISILGRMKIGGWGSVVDWQWLKQGIRITVPFLLATLALRGVFTLDRYWFESLAGIEVLAAYVFFIGIAGTLMSFLDAGVFVFQYPEMIRSWQIGLPAEFRSETLRLAGLTLLFSTGFIVVAFALLPTLIGWIERPIYLRYSSLFPYLILANLLFAVSTIPHYALYAQRRDKIIIFSHVAGFICFVAAVLLLSFWNKLLAVPLALCAAFACLLIIKSFAYFKLTPESYRIACGRKKFRMGKL